MKKKNGFTLVEPLVTIALMLTVLGIAIVSIIKIRYRKLYHVRRNVNNYGKDIRGKEYRKILWR